MISVKDVTSFPIAVPLVISGSPRGKRQSRSPIAILPERVFPSGLFSFYSFAYVCILKNALCKITERVFMLVSEFSVLYFPLLLIFRNQSKLIGQIKNFLF